MRQPFEDADADTKAFYGKTIFFIVLNLNAVQMGLYHTLLCDMEHPLEVGLWKASIPGVIRRMRSGPPEEH